VTFEAVAGSMSIEKQVGNVHISPQLVAQLGLRVVVMVDVLALL
jgi:hypothetical protein